MAAFLAAAIPALIGAASSAIASGAGVGKNKAKTVSFGESKQYDPEAFQYGGREGAAEDAGAAYAGMARDAALRQVDQSRANRYGAMGDAVRAQQHQAAGLMMRRANGSVPSIAGMQAAVDAKRLREQSALDAQRMAAQQASMAAGARGAAGLALAGQQAASNTANGMGAINQHTTMGLGQLANQAQVNAAQERLGAEQAAFGAFGNMRSGDQASQQQAAQQALQQQAMNDQLRMGLLGMEQNVMQSQLQAQIARQQTLASSWNNNQGLYQQRMQANADTGMKFFQAGLGAVQGGMQAAMGGMGGK